MSLSPDFPIGDDTIDGVALDGGDNDMTGDGFHHPDGISVDGSMQDGSTMDVHSLVVDVHDVNGVGDIDGGSGGGGGDDNDEDEDGDAEENDEEEDEEEEEGEGEGDEGEEDEDENEDDEGDEEEDEDEEDEDDNDEEDEDDEENDDTKMEDEGNNQDGSKRKKKKSHKKKSSSSSHDKTANDSAEIAIDENSSFSVMNDASNDGNGDKEKSSDSLAGTNALEDGKTEKNEGQNSKSENGRTTTSSGENNTVEEEEEAPKPLTEDELEQLKAMDARIAELQHQIEEKVKKLPASVADVDLFTGTQSGDLFGSAAVAKEWRWSCPKSDSAPKPETKWTDWASMFQKDKKDAVRRTNSKGSHLASGTLSNCGTPSKPGPNSSFSIRLSREFFPYFGYSPLDDPLDLVKCTKCGCVVRAAFFATHYQHCSCNDHSSRSAPTSPHLSGRSMSDLKRLHEDNKLSKQDAKVRPHSSVETDKQSAKRPRLDTDDSSSLATPIKTETPEVGSESLPHGSVPAGSGTAATVKTTDNVILNVTYIPKPKRSAQELFTSAFRYSPKPAAMPIPPAMNKFTLLATVGLNTPQFKFVYKDFLSQFTNLFPDDIIPPQQEAAQAAVGLQNARFSAANTPQMGGKPSTLITPCNSNLPSGRVKRTTSSGGRRKRGEADNQNVKIEQPQPPVGQQQKMTRAPKRPKKQQPQPQPSAGPGVAYQIPQQVSGFNYPQQMPTGIPPQQQQIQQQQQLQQQQRVAMGNNGTGYPPAIPTQQQLAYQQRLARVPQVPVPGPRLEE